MKSTDSRRDLSIRSIEDANMPFCSHLSSYKNKTVQEQEFHSHGKTQIIVAASGIMSFESGPICRLIDPSQALLIPQGLKHKAGFTQVGATLNLYFGPSLPFISSNQKLLVFSINPLLRELLKRHLDLPIERNISELNLRLMHVLFDEIRQSESPVIQVPLPQDARLRKVVDRLDRDPASEETIEELAKRAGSSPRNLNRLFQKEVGMTFQNWRRLHRIARAIHLMAQGVSVTEVTFEVGFQSVSSFGKLFKQIVGQTPSSYARDLHKKHHVRDNLFPTSLSVNSSINL